MLHKIIDGFVAKVWRNLRGQYQFKTAEVMSDFSAVMFFGGIDLYSVHWVHEANLNLAISWCYSDFTIVHHSRFCEANRNMVPGSPARAKIRDVIQWSLYKSIPPKNMAASKSDVMHFHHFELILTANIPSHFCHETIYNVLRILVHHYLHVILDHYLNCRSCRTRCLVRNCQMNQHRSLFLHCDHDRQLSAHEKSNWNNN